MVVYSTGSDRKVYCDSDSGVMNDDAYSTDDRRPSAVVSGPLPTVIEIDDVTNHNEIKTTSSSVVMPHGNNRLSMEFSSRSYDATEFKIAVCLEDTERVTQAEEDVLSIKSSVMVRS